MVAFGDKRETGATIYKVVGGELVIAFEDKGADGAVIGILCLEDS